MSTKYGLIWERKDTIEKITNDDVILVRQDELSVFNNNAEEPKNLIIEGDNYDALRALSSTHKGKIKCIYIDPPYNKGDKDFIYNDNYVDKDDEFRHSKWLSFMDARLKLAQDLLTQDGVMFISIDDDELANLILLGKQILTGMKYVSAIPWRKRAPKHDVDFNLSVDHEYIVTFAMPKFKALGGAKSQDRYSETTDFPGRIWTAGDLSTQRTTKERENSDFDFAKDLETGTVYVIVRSKDLIPKDNSGNDGFFFVTADDNRLKQPSVKIYPVNPDSCWRVAIGTVGRFLKEKKIIFPGDYTHIRIEGPKMRRFFDELKSQEEALSSWMYSKDHGLGMSRDGTKKIKEIFGEKKFSYPKPLGLIKYIIKHAVGSGDIVLDFFAGSGTTGEAVMAINKEDGGDRQFILVCNRENDKNNPDKNICRDICAERIRRVIKGYTTKDKKKAIIPPLEGNSFSYLVVTKLDTMSS